MHRGYIKLYRCVLDSSWAKQPDFVSVWMHCLLRAGHKDTTVTTKGGATVRLKSGEFMTSRNQISQATGVQESKVERILNAFKNEQQIEQVSNGKYRVISICNWDKYQSCEQVNELKLNSKRTANEHKQECKEEKNTPAMLAALWNEIVKTPKVETMSEARAKKCRTRLGERSLEEWRNIFQMIVNTPFLRGDNDRGWRASFDWIIDKEHNAIKVLEQQYGGGTPKQVADGGLVY